MKKSKSSFKSKSNRQHYELASLFAKPLAKAVVRSSVKMPLATVGSPYRTSVMSAPSVLGRRPHRMAALILIELLSTFYAADIFAEETEVRTLPQVEVIGNQADLKKAQGSAHLIDSSTLEESRVFNVNEALRKVPGVHVRDEEGIGLRPNIGIRGMNPTRSTKVLLLEDGLPLSYAPYGDNASYYHPPIDRYDAIEVSKGSQIIRFGPQTAGGLVNYITPVPQQEFGGIAGFSAGSRGYMNGHVMMTGNGVIADIYHKESDGARNNMNSRMNDINFKWAGKLNDDHNLILRATHYEEQSQLTYSGLTENEYLLQGARYNPFKNDHLDFKRTGTSMTHEWKVDGQKKLLTSVYAAYFDRTWWRQASTTTDCVTAGDRTNGTVISDTALNNCDIGGRIRNYTTTGIDSRLQLAHEIFGLKNQAEFGVKLHNEVQRRRQENYDTYNLYATGGALKSLSEDQSRGTRAISAFASNTMAINNQLSITPVIRAEHITHERINHLVANAQGSDSLFEVIPGIGANYQLDADTLIYGGMHKGFSPPRAEDLINSTGGTVELNAERSINMEIGVRTAPTKSSFVDVAFFRNDFSNNVQVGSIAGGSTTYSEGKALYQGIEMAGQMDRLTTAIEGNLFTRFALTYLATAEQKSLFSTIAGAKSGAVGNRLPYAPENLLTLTLGYRAPENWNARLDYVYVSKQFSDFANTQTPVTNGNGQLGVIEAYGIFNAVFNYTLGKTTFFIAGKNLANTTYIVDRTRGIQVGMPRTVQAGIKIAF